MHKQLILLLPLALVATSAFARPCSMHAADFTVGGQPLTYERAKGLHGAVVVGDTVHIGPVELPNGMNGRVAIERDGCANVDTMLYPRGHG